MTAIWIIAIFLALASIWYKGWDTDFGGYEDGWLTTYRQEMGKGYIVVRDKLAHFLCGLALLLAMRWTGVSRGPAFWIVFAAAFGYEVQQKFPRKARTPLAGSTKKGFFSWRDWVAGIAGAGIGTFLFYVFTHR